MAVAGVWRAALAPTRPRSGRSSSLRARPAGGWPAKLWARLDKAAFLTPNEKRTAAGYREHAGGDELKYAAGQARMPAGNGRESGRWITGDGGVGVTPDGTVVDPAQGRRRGSGLGEATPAELLQLSIARVEAVNAIRRVRERDPAWQSTQQLTDPNNVQGLVEANKLIAQEANQRWSELLRDAIPNTNPDWGVARLRSELADRGYVFTGPTRAPGYLLQNPATGEQVRIMERPQRSYRDDDPQKHLNDFYYRYRQNENLPYGSHITIPNK